MKQKISYSSVVSWLTIIFVVAFVAIFVLFWVFIDKPYDDVFFWILVGLFVLCFCWIFGSTPYSIDADDDYVNEYSRFNKRRYRMSDISNAESYEGGDRGVHFRGKYKYPVLITLKDGRKIVVGSENPKELVDYINSHSGE